MPDLSSHVSAASRSDLVLALVTRELSSKCPFFRRRSCCSGKRLHCLLSMSLRGPLGALTASSNVSSTFLHSCVGLLSRFPKKPLSVPCKFVIVVLSPTCDYEEVSGCSSPQNCTSVYTIIRQPRLHRVAGLSSFLMASSGSVLSCGSTR